MPICNVTNWHGSAGNTCTSPIVRCTTCGSIGCSNSACSNCVRESRSCRKCGTTGDVGTQFLDIEARTRQSSGTGGSILGHVNPGFALAAIAVIAVIAIVVTYWKEILLIGLIVLAVRYRHPLLLFARRIASWFHQAPRPGHGLATSISSAPPTTPIKQPVDDRTVAAPSQAAAIQEIDGWRIVAAPSPSTVPISRGAVRETDGWQRATNERRMTIEGQQYRILGLQVDAQHPGWTHYALQGQGQFYGVSMKKDGARSALVALEPDDSGTPADLRASARPIALGTQIWLPARCGCTGQPFVYRCRFAGGGWTIVAASTLDAAPEQRPTRLADVHGVFMFGEDFAGCPYCHDRNFRSCGCCDGGAMSCQGMKRYDEEGEEELKCGHCQDWHVCEGADEFDFSGAEEMPSHSGLNQHRGLMKAQRRSL